MVLWVFQSLNSSIADRLFKRVIVGLLLLPILIVWLLLRFLIVKILPFFLFILRFFSALRLDLGHLYRCVKDIATVLLNRTKLVIDSKHDRDLFLFFLLSKSFLIVLIDVLCQAEIQLILRQLCLLFVHKANRSIDMILMLALIELRLTD